jgi:hypothetical protein
MEIDLLEVKTRPARSLLWGIHYPWTHTGKAQQPKYPTICAPSLGLHGRWGNSLLQYMFLKVFSEEYAVRLETPMWQGKYIFGLQEDKISCQPDTIIFDGMSHVFTQNHEINILPFDYAEEQAQFYLQSERVAHALIMRERQDSQPNPHANYFAAEMEGIFIVNTKLMAPHREMLLELLTPISLVRHRLDIEIEKIKTSKKTLVGIHIRRGDFVKGVIQGFELITPVSCYREWLEHLWPTLEAPALFIASDDPSAIEAFLDFCPLTSRTLNIIDDDIDFFSDWYMLSRCDVLAISNSTFSFSAALLNPNAKICVRPNFGRELIEFDPWDSEPLLFANPSKILVWELLRRLRLDIQNAGWGSSPRVVFKALYSLWSTIYFRLQSNLHIFGWKGFVKAALHPKTYIAFHYRAQ